ncbi:adenylate kinase, chloroplastic-like isoform X2 [Cucurbita maxima]|uniref:adenylate kinase n=1 Tax=Cucurbita maxima TaxID=3661 RepID=A0A6J1JIP0_CUCMA|nr:adenylate kinase, chloroplastic-like isoform X2 [Cucurbita maxima]
MALYYSSFTAFACPNRLLSSRQRQPNHFPYVSNNLISFTRHCRDLSLPCLAISLYPKATISHVTARATPEPLRIKISGAPASGKGTQCELITWKYGLVHIAAGDLLRAEVNSGSKNGKLAKDYMEKGLLVPNEIVALMVKERLSQPDAQENGWLLDGYPRSSSQANALKEVGFEPDLFILLEVPEEILVERVVGRRLDPVTGKIYHLKYFPPDNEEVAARLTQRFDDTEERVRLRLQTHHQNLEDVLSLYQDVTVKVNGNAPKEVVFDQIDRLLIGLLEQRKAAIGSLAT